RLFASNGACRVAVMANVTRLSASQFERRFLAQVGVPPKLYARIVRFNAALDHKLRWPAQAWSPRSVPSKAAFGYALRTGVVRETGRVHTRDLSGAACDRLSRRPLRPSSATSAPKLLAMNVMDL